MPNLREVMATAAKVRGIKFAELAKAHGQQWSDYAASRKGMTGKLVRAVLGITGDPGFDIRAIPLDEDFRVQERTKIQGINPGKLRNQSWAASDVSKHLRTILFVPVVKPDKGLPGNWYLLSPFIWAPSDEDERQLEADYDAVRALVRAGAPKKISSKLPPKGQGVILIANTSGANKNDKVNWGAEGKQAMERRRSWYLRRSFTQDLVARQSQKVAKA